MSLDSSNVVKVEGFNVIVVDGKARAVKDTETGKEVNLELLKIT